MKQGIIIVLCLSLLATVVAGAVGPGGVSPLPGTRQEYTMLCVDTASGYGTHALSCVQQFNGMPDDQFCDEGEEAYLAGCYYTGTSCTLPNGQSGKDCSCVYSCVKKVKKE